ncbi:methyltransferase domain-containing protein [Candidatus Uhrbacteria bacterium]|nr:methyltransferase domain-containing protein [Candidatus Uhrbacteria bacterium]
MPTIPSGRSLLDSDVLLRRAGLTIDMHYADFGAGMLGHFVLPACEIVGPGGEVYAVDILKEALQSVESRAQMENVTNLHIVWGDFERSGGVKIPAGSLHIISFVNVARVLMKSSVPIEEAKRLLRENGRVLVVDWKPGIGSIIVDEQRRVRSDAVHKLFVEHGFHLLEAFDAGPQHWGLIFKLSTA